MRRKSERNKAKVGAPEKEVEKPTRKPTHRRAKRTPSTSPEEENDELPKSVGSKETEKKSVQIQKKELEQIEERNEQILSTEVDIESKLQEEEEDNTDGSVWKVSRADASPGEIQKLKLCRQLNLSEGSSDASLSRKKSNKWQESGEGVAEEADSADKQLVSCTRTLSSNEQPNDPSSSYPGQDSNEEVSDSKEILPETTSANLSDDKPNIDQQGESNEENISNVNADSEPTKLSSTTMLAPSSNGNRSSMETNVIPKEEKPSAENVSEKSAEVFSKEASIENAKRETSSDEEEDEKVKAREINSSSESIDEIRAEIIRTSGRMQCTSRRKYIARYRDSSNSSDTSDSEELLKLKRDIEIDNYVQEEKTNAEDSGERKDNSESPKARNNLLNNVNVETEPCEANKQKLDNLNDKSVPTTAQSIAYKPVKVNLKRSL